MKKFLIFMAAIAMFACTPNSNIEDPAKKHQPAVFVATGWYYFTLS